MSETSSSLRWPTDHLVSDSSSIFVATSRRVTDDSMWLDEYFAGESGATLEGAAVAELDSTADDWLV